jgi:hypothetical protein
MDVTTRSGEVATNPNSGLSSTAKAFLTIIIAFLSPSTLDAEVVTLTGAGHFTERIDLCSGFCDTPDLVVGAQFSFTLTYDSTIQPIQPNNWLFPLGSSQFSVTAGSHTFAESACITPGTTPPTSLLQIFTLQPPQPGTFNAGGGCGFIIYPSSNINSTVSSDLSLSGTGNLFPAAILPTTFPPLSAYTAPGFQFQLKIDRSFFGVLLLNGVLDTLSAPSQPPLPPCIFTLFPTTKSFPAIGGTDAVSVTASMPTCTWVAVSNDNWLTVLGPRTGTGNDIVNYSVSQNSADADRTGSLTVAGQSFTVTQAGANSCGDERDRIIQGYKDFGVQDILHGAHSGPLFVPVCSNFTKTGSNAFYSFPEFNISNQFAPNWALIRTPLAFGLDQWIRLLGAKKPLNSAYRTPADLIRIYSGLHIPAPKGSRHMFGDAADLDVPSKSQTEWRRMVKAAKDVGAAWTEPDRPPFGCFDASQGAAAWRCAHADWDGIIGSYLP